MEQVTIIGIDLAKRVFQAHGAAANGSAVFRKKLSRGQFLSFLAAQPRCTVAMDESSRFCRRPIASFHATISNTSRCA